jgi:trehalose/maltose hydrolase-like predicted phosphorylase
VAIDGGIHIAALGGIWLIAVFGFAGLALEENGLALNPQLPPSWTSLGFKVQWRGRSLKMRIGQAERNVSATLEVGEPMTLHISGQPHELRSGQALLVSIGEVEAPMMSQPSDTLPIA